MEEIRANLLICGIIVFSGIVGLRKAVSGRARMHAGRLPGGVGAGGAVVTLHAVQDAEGIVLQL
eukprot:scaffold650244_cov51-Prasinocladus_malaysianus.AAC.1